MFKNTNGMLPNPGDFIMVSRSHYEDLLLRANKVIQNETERSNAILEQESYYNTEEVMALLKVSRQTIKNWRDEGILPYRKFGRKVLFKTEDLEKLEHKMIKRGVSMTGETQWNS